MNPRTAVLAGATGLVGRHCLTRLLDSPDYRRVVVLTRRPLGLGHPRLIERPADFNSLGTPEPADDVFCALGTTIRKAGSRENFRRVDFDYPMKLAEWALTGGAKQYLLVSSVDAAATASTFYLRVKGELEEALARLPFTALHLFRPSMLLGLREESRPAERIGQIAFRALQFAMAGPLRRYRPMPAATLGTALVEAAIRESPGRHVYQYDEIVRLARS